MTVTEYYRTGGAWRQIGGGSIVEPPPPEPLEIIYGSNIGNAQNVTTLISELNPQIVRVYSPSTDTANTTSWSSAANPAKDVPTSIGVSWTAKPSVATWQTGASGHSAEVTRWRTILGGAPANQLIWFGLWHEPWDQTPDGVKAGETPLFTIAEWREMMINFRTEVIDFVNSSRDYPILFNCNLHGESATGGHQVGGVNSIDLFLTPEVVEALHEITWDTYNTAHTPAWIDWMIANGQGKRFGIWETGYTLNQSPTDQQVFDRMKYFVETQYPSLPANLSYVCWFNSAGDNPYNAITNGANEQARLYWKALCESCPKATQEVYFNGYNP